MLQKLLDYLHEIWNWIYNALMWLPRFTVHELLTGIASLLNGIPVPSFITNAASYINQLPSSFGYWFQLLHLGFGLQVVLSAMLLRWLIHKIPFIGK